jgi:hypothetical protein
MDSTRLDNRSNHNFVDEETIPEISLHDHIAEQQHDLEKQAGGKFLGFTVQIHL